MRSQQVMREKKRLEHVLATDADLARRGDDIAAYFDLAKEARMLTAICSARSAPCATCSTNSRPKRCFRAKTMRATPS